MKYRKEEILDNVCKKSYEDAGEVWNGQKHDYKRFQILLAMEQYAEEMAVGFANYILNDVSKSFYGSSINITTNNDYYKQYLESVK